MSGKDRRTEGPTDRKPSRRRALTQDERAVWTTFTKTIVPLAERVVAPDDDMPEPPVSGARAPAPPSKRRAGETKSASVKAAPPPAPPPMPPLAPLDRRAKRRVASGRSEIDGRIDLHGHTQAEAHAALSRFLGGAAGRGARLVLVITGKSGVLRRQVPQWLALPEFRGHVIGYEAAHVAHGGEGALYVRLRRAR